jgi:enoyl-CoA hydratase/carnithine racemase
LTETQLPSITLSSPSQSILVEMLETGAAQIWLNRPERLNALGVEMVDTLAKVIADVLAVGANAIFLRAKGRGFCAGADLKERLAMADAERHNHNRAINGAVNALAAAPVPTVAVINGVALGGGLELALSCDLRIAAESALLGLTEARIGAIPGAGGTQRLPRLIGISRALEMMYLGEPIAARRAFEVGLVSAWVPDEELENAVLQHIAVLGSRSPSVSRMLKKIVYEGMEMPLAEGLERERQAVSTVLGSADYAEGLAAFAAKRVPKFSR